MHYFFKDVLPRFQVVIALGAKKTWSASVDILVMSWLVGNDKGTSSCVSKFNISWQWLQVNVLCNAKLLYFLTIDYSKSFTCRSNAETIVVVYTTLFCTLWMVTEEDKDYSWVIVLYDHELVAIYHSWNPYNLWFYWVCSDERRSVMSLDALGLRWKRPLIRRINLWLI